MSHPYAKEAKAGQDRKLKAYGGQSGNQPLTHAGFPALNTDTQAGRAPLNSKDYIPPEVSARTARKKGGKVMGAQSLKRLDKAPRKGKSPSIPTGTRKGEIPSGTTEQVEFDPTLKIEPGEMSEASPRKKGGGCGMKKGGKIQDYEARSHESQGAQGLRKRQAHAAGGKAKHDDEAEDRALIKKMVKPEDLTGKSCGGSARTKRADGGGAWGDYGASEGGSKSSGGKKGSGKTNVNIIIGGMPGQGQQAGAMDALLGAAMAQQGAGGPPPVAPPAPPPGAMPPPGAGAPPPMMAGPPPAPVGGPPQMPPGGLPMPRKDGGKVQVPYKKPGKKDGYPAMDFGSGGGFGRKQKIDSYGTKGPKGDSV